MVLRRMENTRATSLANRSGSCIGNSGDARGVICITVERTFGGGAKAPGPTWKSVWTSIHGASMTVSRP